METLISGVTQVGIAVVALALIHRPLGAYMARVLEGARSGRVERAIYRVLHVDECADQSWVAYALSVIAFSLVSIVGLYALLRASVLFPAPWGHEAGMGRLVALNTAISFVTNTNWQAYTPETTLGFVAQAGGLAVQNFASAAVGICVAAALARGFARARSGGIGNFWVDYVRVILRLLLPLAFVSAVVLLLGGVAQSFAEPLSIHTLSGDTQLIATGPVASQEAIKELGTNGGGYFAANSAHPLENPNLWTNLFEIVLILAIPTALPRTFGIIVDDARQGRAILAAMGVLATLSLALTSWAEWSAWRQGAASVWEGKELRFGILPSSLFATATTLTSTGAVDSMHASYTPAARAVLTLNMLLGEIAPGGVGSGLYGIIIVAIIAVFLAGLMVGRSPEYIGKKIGRTEMTLASLYTLVTPALVLAGVGLTYGLDSVREAQTNTGAAGLGEVLYAFASAANNNGSAMAGLDASIPPLALGTSIAMLVGRFLPMVCVLALAGALASAGRVGETAGTLPTHRPLFVGMTVGVALIVTGLTFVPVMALAPLVEGLS